MGLRLRKTGGRNVTGQLFVNLKLDNAAKLACIEREIKMRERVYPRWVAAGKMSQEKADLELEVMRAIAEDYK